MKRKAAILCMAGLLMVQTPLAVVAETTVSGNELEEVDVLSGNDAGEAETVSGNAYNYPLSYWDIDLEALGIEIYDGADSVFERASYPSAYRSDNVGGVSYVPPLRDQGKYGTCWAFSALGACEASLLKQGTATVDIDLSESHLAYFLYNKGSDVGDPLGNTIGDYNYLARGTDYLKLGGNNYLAMLQLIGWAGPVSESASTDYAYSTILNNAALKMPNTTKAVYGSDAYHVKNCYLISTGNRNLMKKMITEYGAVAMSYYSDEAYDNFCVQGSNASNDEGNYYCYDKEKGTNHAVQIIGWDDNYDKSKFVKQPAGNGAWLVKNNWGAESSSLAQQGYFWMSYYDNSLSSDGYVYECDTVDNYDHLYQYDGSASLSVLLSTAEVGNIFTAKANGNLMESLRAVSIVVDSADVDYTVDIYTNVIGSDPTSGKKVMSQSGTFLYSGYHTVELNTPVYVAPNRNYSVVFRFTNGNARVGFDATSSYYPMYTMTSQKEGQSYYRGSTQAAWNDAASQAGTVRVKAFTEDTNVVPRNLQGISLSAGELNLDRNASQTLTVGFNPSNHTDSEYINWTSSNESVATVQNGVVTAKKYGSATITATTPYGHSASCVVNVVTTDAAHPVLLSAESTASNKVKLTWVRAYNAAGYQIYRSTSKKGTYTLVKTVTSGSKTSFTDSKVACGTTYYYKIKAYRKSGKKKILSSFSSRLKEKAVPSTAKLKTVTVSKKNARLKWSKVSKASGYEIYRSTSADSKGKKIATVGAKTSYTDKKAKGKTYYYRVRAYQLVNGKKVYGSLSEAMCQNG